MSVSSYYDYPSATIHIAVVENVYSNSSGSNGETEFHQVMKNASGNGTSADLSNGNTITVSESYISLWVMLLKILLEYGKT